VKFDSVGKITTVTHLKKEGITMKSWSFPLALVLIVAGAASAEADQKKKSTKPKQIYCEARTPCREVAPGCHLEYTSIGGATRNREVCDGRK
jgi:hypothetical protein